MAAEAAAAAADSSAGPDEELLEDDPAEALLTPLLSTCADQGLRTERSTWVSGEPKGKGVKCEDEDEEAEG